MVLPGFVYLNTWHATMGANCDCLPVVGRLLTIHYSGSVVGCKLLPDVVPQRFIKRLIGLTFNKSSIRKRVSLVPSASCCYVANDWPAVRDGRDNQQTFQNTRTS